MERLGSPSKRSTVLLRRDALRAVLSSVLTPPTELPVIGGVLRPQGGFLFRRQLDISYPDAHRRLRDGNPASNLVDWKSFASKPSRDVSFACFHFRKQ